MRADSTLRQLGWVLVPLVMSPLLGASAADLRLTEAQLAKYDGTGADGLIYLAIEGKVFDVSAAPKFYGPGGAYHHFTGKDATRAWITECWEDADQLTWRLEGVEDVFAPVYLDEELEKVHTGQTANLHGTFKDVPDAMLKAMAAKAVERFGDISPVEKARRRKQDREAAQKKIREKIDHWTNFFESNDKYKVVGEVVHDKKKPAPPPICEAAQAKKPIEGGKVDDLAKDSGGIAYDKRPENPAVNNLRENIIAKDKERLKNAQHEEL